MDHRLQYSCFIDEVQSGDKFSLATLHMIQVNDDIVNKMVKDGTIIYNAVSKYYEFRQILPSS